MGLHKYTPERVCVVCFLFLRRGVSRRYRHDFNQSRPQIEERHRQQRAHPTMNRAHTPTRARADFCGLVCVCVCPRLYTVQCQHLLITFCISALCVCICFVVSSASARAAAASRVQQIFDLSAGGSGFDRQNCVLFFDAPVQCFDCSDSDRMRVLVSCDCASAAMAVTMLLTLTVASSTGSRHRRQAGFSLADLLAQENGNTPNSNPNNEYNYYTGDNQGKRSALLLKLFIT